MLGKKSFIGLLISLTLIGVRLYFYLPRIEAMAGHWFTGTQRAETARPAAPGLAPGVQRPPAPAAGAQIITVSGSGALPKVTLPASGGGARFVTMPAPTEKPQAVALAPPVVAAPKMPEGWEHGGLAPAPLPSVIHPDSPVTAWPKSFKPGSAYAGTGFFIAFDGSLLTAAHVVAGCTKAEIISSKVPLAVAAVLATDTRQDIALLRAPNVRPQTVLPIGSPPPAGRLFVLGYPATADLRVPEEDWPNLRTDRILRSASVAGGNDGIWLETTRITHGYSGGPVVDPRTGAVVGIVRAEITGGTIATITAPGFHLTTGPTGDRLANFVHKEAPWIDIASTQSDGYEATEAARLATVHVICLH